MKLEAITAPSPAPRSDLENLIIGMNKARKGDSTPQENSYTLRIAEKMQREAFTRGDGLFTSEFTELFNFVCEQQPAPLEATVIDGDYEVIEGKTSAPRPPKEYLKLTVETAASYRFLTDLQKRIEERAAFFEVDVLRAANHYGITRQAIRQYLRDYANKGLIALKIENPRQHNVAYCVGPTAEQMQEALQVEEQEEHKAPVVTRANTKSHTLMKYIQGNATEVAIYINPDKLSVELNIKSTSLVTMLNIFKNKGYIFCKSVGNGVRLVRFIDVPADYFN